VGARSGPLARRAADDPPAARRPRASGAHREHLLAVALLGGLLLVYLWPALLGGRLLTDDAALYLWAPWKSEAPSNYLSFVNPLLIDVAQYHYQWDLYVRAALHGGRFPSWNPYVLSGTPYYTNSQNGLTSLFDVPLWVLPLHYALGLVAWLKLMVAGLGAYALSRTLKLGMWPGLLAGVCFALCAFNVDWLEHQTLVASSVWLPWLVLAVELTLRERRVRVIVALALLAALTIDGGHPGTEVQTLGAAGLYALVRAATLADATARARLAGLARVAIGMLIGGLLMAFVVVPVILASHGTSGAAAREGGGFTLPVGALRTLFFPGWWGRPSEGNNLAPVNYVERTVYAGSIALLLALVAIASQRAWRYKVPLVVVGLVGLAVGFGFGPVHWVVVHLPLFASVQDARMVLWTQFAIAMLGAFGLQSLIDHPELRRRAWRVLGAGVIVALLALAGLFPTLHELHVLLEHFLTGRGSHEVPMLALIAVVWWLVFLAALALLLWLGGRGWISQRTLAIALVLAATLDMYHFAQGFAPMESPRQLPASTPGMAFLERTAGESRVVGTKEALLADTNINYGVREPTGQDPPQPSLRYFRLWRLANPSQSEEFILTLPRLTPTALKVMSLLGVRYVVTDPRTPLELALPIVYRGRDLLVYSNDLAVPPAFVPRSVLAVDGESQQLSLIAGSLHPQREAMIEAGSGSAVSAGAGTVAIEHEEGATVRMTAHMSRGGLVVLNDAWAPGWSVSVDGRAAKVLRVNDVMRGVVVPEGAHTIVWHYRVPGLVSGIAISLLTLLGTALTLVWLVLRRRSRRPVARPPAPAPDASATPAASGSL
jgi:hypothetical protein